MLAAPVKNESGNEATVVGSDDKVKDGETWKLAGLYCIECG
jgi:uncharacterized membrane protein